MDPPLCHQFVQLNWAVTSAQTYATTDNATKTLKIATTNIADVGQATVALTGTPLVNPKITLNPASVPASLTQSFTSDVKCSVVVIHPDTTTAYQTAYTYLLGSPLMIINPPTFVMEPAICAAGKTSTVRLVQQNLPTGFSFDPLT